MRPAGKGLFAWAAVTPGAVLCTLSRRRASLYVGSAYAASAAPRRRSEAGSAARPLVRRSRIFREVRRQPVADHPMRSSDAASPGQGVESPWPGRPADRRWTIPCVPLPSAAWEEIRNSLGLSLREFEIALHVMKGLSEVEIADHLGSSPSTVHTHLERIYRRLGIRSRCALVARLFGTYVRLGEGDDG